MEIPLYILPIIYGAGIVMWIIMTLFVVYQVVRYGTFTKVPLIAMFAYLFFCLFVIGITWFTVRNVDWSSTVDLRAPSISIPTTIPSIFPK